MVTIKKGSKTMKRFRLLPLLALFPFAAASDREMIFVFEVDRQILHRRVFFRLKSFDFFHI